jgi:hypothetical protein
MVNHELEPARELMVDQIEALGESLYIMPQKDLNARTLMHISTDKMIYKPLDVMFVEVFLVDSLTKKPYILDSELPKILEE